MDEGLEPFGRYNLARPCLRVEDEGKEPGRY